MYNGPNLTTKGRVFFFENSFLPLPHPIHHHVPALPAFSVFIVFVSFPQLSFSFSPEAALFPLAWPAGLSSVESLDTLWGTSIQVCWTSLCPSFSRHCALPLNWVGGGKKISETWTLCSKVYSLPDETKPYRLVSGHLNDYKMCISGSMIEYEKYAVFRGEPW